MLVLRMIEEQFHRDADDDRPLREGRMPPALLRDGEIEYRACPYAGTRRGLPMNVSALRQTSARWDDSLGALALLRRGYLAAIGAADAAPIALIDAWRISQLGSALPWWFILRAPGATTPAYAAALSKATLGTGILAQRLIVEAVATGRAPASDAPALLAAAEATATLVSDAEACAAPDRMILRFLEVLAGPAAGRELAAPAALVAALPAALGFGAHYLGWKHVLWLGFLARRFVLADAAAALGDHPLAARAIALRGAEVQPPDFFAVDPPAALAPAQRTLWLAALAQLLAPFAPDGSDRALRTAADQLARAAGATPDPAHAALAPEIAATTGLPAPAAAALAHAAATYAALDAALATATAAVEAGFRAALGHPVGAPRFDAAARDRVVPASPRELFRALAPVGFDRLAPA